MTLRLAALVVLLAVAPGLAAQTTLAGLPFEAFLGPSRTAIGDVDGDGDRDLVTSHALFLNTLQMFVNRGDGSFEAPTPIADLAAGGIDALELVDLDGDGALDVLALPYGVWLGTGAGTFGPLLPVPGLDAFDDVLFGPIADLDGDGLLDALVVPLPAGGSIDTPRILHGQPDATFVLGPPVDALDGLSSTSFAGEVDGDGIVDLFGATLFPGGLAVARGLGGGAYASLEAVDPFLQPILPVSGDFDGDGLADLASSCPPDEALCVDVYLADGEGGFAWTDTLPGDGFSKVAGDFDGDGRLDLAYRPLTGTSQVASGRGDGTFEPPRTFGPDALVLVLQPGDVDQDGRTDLVANEYYAERFHMLYGSPAPFVDLHLGGGAVGLSGTGSTMAEEAFTLSVDAPAGTGLLFASFASDLVPLPGGTFVPLPIASVPVAAGTSLTARWPSGLPEGTTVLAQAWLLADGEVSGSNALALVAMDR